MRGDLAPPGHRPNRTGAALVWGAVALMGLVLGWISAGAPAAGMAAAVGAALGAAGRGRGPGLAFAASLAAVAVAVGLGVSLGAAQTWGPQARAHLVTGPITGVHPMQHVALRLDGFGPHDLVVDDHVEPQGSRGIAGPELARRLEAQIHAVGSSAYPRTGDAQPWANGRPVAARMAWTHARVTAEPATAEGGFATHRLRIVSGGRGEGARVEPACPASPTIDELDDPAAAGGSGVARECPSRYVFPGDAGLAWRHRFGARTRDGSTWSTARLGRPLTASLVWLGLALATGGLVRLERGDLDRSRVRSGVAVGLVAASLVTITVTAARRSSPAAVVDALAGALEPWAGTGLPAVYSGIAAGLSAVPILGLAWMIAAALAEARIRAANSRTPRGPAHA